MKNENPSHAHDEINETKPLSDDMLKDVTGGGGASPSERAFDLDEYVYIRSTSQRGDYRLCTGLITDYEYDDDLHEWTYLILFGKIVDSKFFATTGVGNEKYYPQSQINRV